VPAGRFMMGSPSNEVGRGINEDPQHEVLIRQPFAVSKFELTIDEWNACVANGGCKQKVDDLFWAVLWGRIQRPAIDMSWDDAKQYVAWIALQTGKPYRLLSEAEWEYAARAGTQTAYSWGDQIGAGNANCDGCGSRWDNRQTAPVGSFVPNAFGLYDMHGNVWEWVEDCYNDKYIGAPTDGSAWTTQGDCGYRLIRGGSWNRNPELLRSASRIWLTTGIRSNRLGLRVGRTLNP
jgi:formylglycine-generating enzyme required for sulfatase activity